LTDREEGSAAQPPLRIPERERGRLRLILDNVSEAITAVFLDTGDTVRNRAWLTFHGFESFDELRGWTLEEIAPLFEIFGGDGQPLPLSEVPLSRALRGETFRDLEVRLRRRSDGREWWGSYNGGALRDESGKVVAALISMRDVTERRRAEEALRALVEERDRLLVELNHRVKNNLQLVSGLLAIQAARGGDSGTAELFEQARQRIGAIAQVHASLYQSRRVGTLEFAAYLRDLCGALADSFVDDGRNRRVGLEVDAQPLWLEADRAMPLGLILNELVTNALKHGRREAGTASMVLVGLRPLDGGGAWRLEVTNDGPAPAEDAGPARVGLGMQLVEGFARQLQGTVAVERAPRFRVWVDFPA